MTVRLGLTLIKHGESRHGGVVALIAVLLNAAAIWQGNSFFFLFFPELCMIIEYCIVILQFSFNALATQQ
jgi:hypothetical protein